MRHRGMKTLSVLLSRVKGINQSPEDYPHKGSIKRSFMFPLLLAWTLLWTNSRFSDGLKRHDAYVTSQLWKINCQAVRIPMLWEWFGIRLTRYMCCLTHWDRDKMAAIFQMTFSNSFSWTKCMNFDRISLKFVCKGPINNIPALVQINVLAPTRRQAIIWTNDW